MVLLQALLGFIIKGVIAVFFNPIFWTVVAVIGYQYWQMRKKQIQLFGLADSSLVKQVGWAILYGTVGGIFGSMLATVVGISINDMGLNYIWLVALGLMIIDMRFLCFAYAGGLVSLASLLFGWPIINVPQVLGLVAILHFTESILIAISGRYSASPLIIKAKDGRLVGAFSLQNFWPLPLVLMAATAVPLDQVVSGVGMPEWWPLFPVGIDLPEGNQWLYMMIPVMAALGYSDMAVASLPQERRRSSALHLAFYSAILLGLSLLSTKYYLVQFLAAILSPLGHELLIQYDNHKEMQGVPRLVPPERGLMVLDSVKSSPARKLKIRPGDVILMIGDRPINSRSDFEEALLLVPESFSLQVERNGKLLTLQTKFREGERRLGVMLVPDGTEKFYMRTSSKGFGLWDWLWEKYQQLRK